jgi:hypothetical protein
VFDFECRARDIRCEPLLEGVVMTLQISERCTSALDLRQQIGGIAERLLPMRIDALRQRGARTASSLFDQSFF